MIFACYHTHVADFFFQPANSLLIHRLGFSPLLHFVPLQKEKNIM